MKSEVVAKWSVSGPTTTRKTIFKSWREYSTTSMDINYRAQAGNMIHCC